MTPRDDVGKRLRDGAEEVARGRIRVDAKQALAKLRDHRLADPHHYVLELVRAAVACGAKAIDIRTDADDVELTWDGAPFPPVVLRELFAYAVGGGADEPAGRLLALGVVGALALRPRYVIVEGSGVRVEARPPDRVVVTEGPSENTRVHVRDRAWRVLKRVFSSPEAEVIRARAARAPAAIVVNGAALEPPAAPPSTREVRQGSLHVVASLVEPGAGGQVTFNVYGVDVVTRRAEEAAAYIVAWARDDRLQRNASGDDIVLDQPAYREALKAVAGLEAQLVAALCADAESDRPLATAIAVRALARRVAIEAIDRAPLLPGPGGEWVTRGALVAELVAGRPVRVSRRPLDPELYDAPAVLLSRPIPAAALVPDGPRLDIEEAARLRARRRQNRARFDELPVEEARVPGAHPARAWIEGAAFRGEVVLPAGGIELAQVRFLRGGRGLDVAVVPELDPLRVVAVVDSDAFEGNATWEGIAHDAAWRRALEEIRKAALAAFLAQPASTDDLRRHGRDLAAAFAAGPLPDGLLRTDIYPLVGGGYTSLQAMRDRGAAAFTGWAHPDPLLDGTPVVILRAEDRAALVKLVGRVHDVTHQLEKEADIRRRLRQPKEEAHLRADVIARVPLEDLRGEVGLPHVPEGLLRIRLLRDGFWLEDVAQATRLGGAIAVVDEPRLVPAASWQVAERDRAFNDALAVVARAERRLARALIDRYRGKTFGQLPDAARAHIFAFLRAEGSRDSLARPDDAQLPVFTAKLFPALGGPVSLADIARAAEEGRLHAVLPQHEHLELPEGWLVLRSWPEVNALIKDVLGAEPKSAAAEVRHATAVAQFRAQPAREATVDGDKVAIQNPPFAGEMAWRPGAPPGAEVTVLHQGRPYCLVTFVRALAYEAVVDASQVKLDVVRAKLDDKLQRKLKTAVKKGERALVDRALADPAREPFLLAALAAGADADIETSLRKRLYAHPLFPTLGGEKAAADDFAIEAQIPYVTLAVEPLSPEDRKALVVAHPAVRAALGRWADRLRDRTAEFQEARARRAALASRPVVADVVVDGRAVHRRKFRGPGREGEVAIVPGAPRLALYIDRRHVCDHQPAWPANVSAALSSDRLTLTAAGDDVVGDAHYVTAVDAAEQALIELADDLGARWESLPADDKRALPALVAPLLLWLIGRGVHAGLDLPVFVTTAGEPLSLRSFYAAEGQHGSILVAERDGTLLDDERWVWRPRPGEAALLGKLGFHFGDANGALAAAEAHRAGPQLPLVDIRPTSWREVIAIEGVEGEVALPDSPTGRLTIELLRERRMLVSFVHEHPLGGAARVNGSFRLDPSGAALRDPLWDRAVAAVEEALERLAARRLALPDGARFLAAVLKWPRARSGPIAESIDAMPLFRDARGGKVTVGRARAEAAERGRLRIVEPGLAVDGIVVAADALARELLQLLDIPFEDVTDLERRRVTSLRWEGDAVARLEILEPGFRGELALPWPLRDAHIDLLQDGIRQTVHRSPVGVGGMIERDDAAVPLPLARWLAVLVRRLAEPVPEERRSAAGRYLVRWLASTGVREPHDVVRPSAALEPLVGAKLFETAGGRWIDLRAVADRIARRGQVHVLPGRAPEEGDVALLGGRAWLADLVELFGPERVVVHARVEEWRQARRDEDPEPGTPLHDGLMMLRAEAEALRAGAFARLGPAELSHIRVRRGEGKAPVIYEGEVAYLDLTHAGVQGALAGGRRDKVYALLTAIFGVVNRALATVSDDDEARACGALLVHLAANPRSLDG